jgi:hypothetical protein
MTSARLAGRRRPSSSLDHPWCFSGTVCWCYTARIDSIARNEADFTVSACCADQNHHLQRRRDLATEAGGDRCPFCFSVLPLAYFQSQAARFSAARALERW